MPITAASPPTICDSMQELAATTWAHFAYALQRPMRLPDERAFTEHHAIELAIRHPALVEVQLFSSSREAETGADLELWLGDGSTYFAMLVQAKKLSRKSRYESIDHRVGRGGSRGFQLDLLIAACSPGGAYPRHAPIVLMFNGPIPAVRIPADRCKNLFVAVEQRGCTIADAREVAAAARRPGPWEKRWSSIGPLTWPWQCLLCCPRLGDAFGFHQRAAAMLSGHADRNGAWTPSSEPDEPFWTQDELPSYLSPFTEAGANGADHMLDDVRPGAARVMVISTAARF